MCRPGPVPSPESKVWKRLNAIAQLYVNSWDPVPRLPSEWEWVEGACKAALTSLDLKKGPLTMGVPFAEGMKRKFLSTLQATYLELKSRLATYDTVGTTFFIGSGIAFAMAVPTDCKSKSHKAHLQRMPDDWGWFVLDQHGSSRYLAVLTELCEQSEALSRAFALWPTKTPTK